MLMPKRVKRRRVPGRVMFELAGVPEEKAREAMRLAAHKLPIKCKFVKKEDLDVKGGE